MASATVQTKFGPMLIAVIFSMLLQGILISQMYSYYLRYRGSDTWLTKSLVLYLLVVETLNCGFSVLMIYDPLVSQFGNPTVPTVFPLGLVAVPILMVAVSTPIQLFVARRIVRFQKSYWTGGFIAFLSAISFTAGAASTYILLHFNSFERKQDLTIANLTWLSSAAAADVLIAVSLAFSLWKKKTGFKSTDAVLSKIILLTVQTGLISSIFAVLNVVFLCAFPIQNSSNLVFNFALMRTYSIFLLATLNARSLWSDGFQFARCNMSLLYDESPDGALPIRFHREPTSVNAPFSFVPNREYATIEVPKPALVTVQNSITERTRGTIDSSKSSYSASENTSTSSHDDSDAPRNLEC